MDSLTNGKTYEAIEEDGMYRVIAVSYTHLIVRIIVRPKLCAVVNAVGIGSFKKAQRGVKVVFVIEFGVCGRLFGGKFDNRLNHG